MTTYKREKNIQNASFIQVGSRPDCMVWRQHVGKFRHLQQPEQIISVGDPGMADSMMVVAITVTSDMVGKTIGAAVAPEFKAAAGRQSAVQKNWQRAFEARGGIYRLVRSPEEMEQLVEDVKSGRLFRMAD